MCMFFTFLQWVVNPFDPQVLPHSTGFSLFFLVNHLVAEMNISVPNPYVKIFYNRFDQLANTGQADWLVDSIGQRL
jgi:hypothetical protein